MSNRPQVSADLADTMADHVCRQRVLHAALTIVAAWLAYLALRQGDWSLLPEWCGRAGAALATLIGATYAVWSILFGDRLVWARSFWAARDDEQNDHHSM